MSIAAKTTLEPAQLDRLSVDAVQLGVKGGPFVQVCGEDL